MKIPSCFNHSRIYQYLAAIGANFAFLACGMHYGWAAGSLDLLTSGDYTFQISDAEGSWLVSMMPLGAFVGDIIAATLVDIIGRKKIALFTVIPLSISWLFIALAPTAIYMFIGRFIAGVADGIAFTTVPSYLSEISDPEIRGLLCSSYPVTLVFGMLFMNILQYFFTMNTACYIGAVILLLSYTILPFVPDSPYFHLMKENTEAATISLQKFTGKTDVSVDVSRIRKGLMEEKSQKGGFSELLTTSLNIKALMVCLVLCGGQQLAGSTAITSYSTKVFNESKNIMSPTGSNIIFFSLNLVGSLISLVLVDRCGRKILSITSITLAMVCLTTNGLYLCLSDGQSDKLQLIPFISILTYVFVFSIGMTTVPLIVASEILPSHVKGAGLCLTNFTFSIVSTATVNYYTWASDNFGLYVPFFTFAFFSLLTLVFIVVVVPETKDKTLEDIQNHLRKFEKEDTDPVKA